MLWRELLHGQRREKQMSHVHRQATQLGSSLRLQQVQHVCKWLQAALKTRSRVSGNGSIICVLKLVDSVVCQLHAELHRKLSSALRRTSAYRLRRRVPVSPQLSLSARYSPCDEVTVAPSCVVLSVYRAERGLRNISSWALFLSCNN